MNGKTVLIVDDEPAIREMIAVALEMADYDYFEAEDARQAHALVVDRQPDLILLDWMLSGTSGVELARRLKKEEATADIPIIMLTAKLRKTTRSRAWKSAPMITSPSPSARGNWLPG